MTQPYRFRLAGGDTVTIEGASEDEARRTLAEHVDVDPADLILADGAGWHDRIMEACTLGCERPCEACLDEEGVEVIDLSAESDQDGPVAGCDCSACRPDIVRLPAWTGWLLAAALGASILLRRR